jgi:hypothetical protein
LADFVGKNKKNNNKENEWFGGSEEDMMIEYLMEE